MRLSESHAAPRPFGLALLAGASSLALCCATAARAQDSQLPEAPAAQTVAVDQEIVVTGSRIRSATITSPSPLQEITAETLENSGATNVLDVLTQIPAASVPGQSRVTNAQDTNPGISTVNLRGLGVDRTLVLIDGRRTVAGIPGTSQVDLSMIPTSFVQRIDVLTGGASAVYGSDAIAGVVNFIYKKDFEGFEANAQAGISEMGDDERFTFGATLGQNFANGRGNVMLYAGYKHEGPVYNAREDRTARFYSSVGNIQRVNANSDQNMVAAQNLFVPFYQPSSVGPMGVFNFGGLGSRLILPNGTLDRYPAQNASTYNDPATISKVEQYGFNGNGPSQLAAPADQLIAAMRTNYDVTDRLNVFAETTFSNFKSQGVREASPMRTDSALGAFTGTGGYFPIQFQVANPNNPADVRILNNPFVPTAVFNAADNRNNNDTIGSKDVSFLVRTTMFGNGTRSTPTERDNFRIAFGGDYELGGDWVADFYYQYGFTKQRQSMTGLADLYRLAQAVQVIPDVFDLNRNGNTTEAICVDANARAQGCVPLNPFGFNADGTTKISPEAVTWLQTELSRYSKQTMQAAGANIGGTLFQLPAGPVQVAVGAEWRSESSLDDFDPLTNAARNGYVQLNDTSGEFNVKEAYGEINIPLLASTPFFHSLSVRGAARVSDYSTVGSFWAWNVGAEWAPIPDLRFRGVYAHAVRAPNIGELFAAPAAGIISINDPCQGVTLAQTSATAVNCRADPGVLANINANGGTFTLTSSDVSGVGSLTANNPNIQEETGKTLTLGVVINPVSVHALRNLTLTVDYYDIQLEDAINRVSQSTVLNKCYVAGEPEFCQFVTRRSQPSGAFSIGSVEQVVRGLINSGGSFTRGIDVTLNYNHLMFGGVGTLSASWTHLIKQGFIPLSGDTYDNTMGEIGTPRDAFNVTLGWEGDVFGITINNEYVGEQMFDAESYQSGFKLADGSLPDRKYFTIDPRVYTDVQLRANVLDNFEFYIGVNNLLDVDQPLLWYGTPNGNTNGIWDPIGRRYYTGVRLKF